MPIVGFMNTDTGIIRCKDKIYEHKVSNLAATIENRFIFYSTHVL